MRFSTIAWKEEYSVGLTDVDDQHKRFLSIINELGEYINNKTYKENGNQIYFALVHFADVYLMKEKMLVNSVADVDYSFFREKHTNFIAKLKQFKENYKETGSEQLCVDLYMYLKELYPEFISYYTPSLVKILKNQKVD